ncbi:MAG: 7-carboxy-7-deazaguanine synthase QueE [Bacteroidetes bacterium]|nr:MAG: 7-carboxy-7-deazaguanine synthase QueE [Bacteroidota bacterium]
MSVQKDVFEGGKMLPLVEEFYTVQGEGYHTGKAAYFIRIGGCDVGCAWCDTKFAWNPDLHPLVPFGQIIDHVLEQPVKDVVVTGGEPLMVNMGPLTQSLKAHGIGTFLETSGAYPLSGCWDWICLSPKEGAAPVGNIHQLADELKVIIHDEADFRRAEEHASLVGEKCFCYLQPEWSRREAMIPLITAYVMANPKWMVSIQAHKYLHIP